VDARAVIAALRRGEAVPSDALTWFARGLADQGVSDAQAGAFAMAVCLQGLGAEGRAALTLAMRDSGRTLAWDVPGPVLDKHSTGGVGDCVSLVLAPALAACGAFVPMISGRGLGHTGGTLDKMEAIPGLSTQVTGTQFHKTVSDVGCAIVSASADIAPADKRLYAIRDVTATVESMDLITASILSKKLAAGLQGLVLDVKVGSGAFMKTHAEARELAQALVETTAKLSQVIANGQAAEIFGRMVAAMGGPLAFVDTPERFLPEAPVIREITAQTSGVVTGFDGEALGLVIVALGGGRQVESDVVNPAVGLSDVVPAGTAVTKGQPLARVHAARESQADAAIASVRAAIIVGDMLTPQGELIREVIS